MDKKERVAVPAVGGSSLLVIFAVLCLTIFALLCLSTVQANARLSDASARAVAGYYRADAQAEEILARLRGGELPEGVICTNGIYAYSCPISDRQVLMVQLRKVGTSWKVLQWQAVSIVEWE